MAGTVEILTDLFSLLSIYNCPATNITAANKITNVALATCETSLIRFPRYWYTLQMITLEQALSSAAPGHSSGC